MVTNKYEINIQKNYNMQIFRVSEVKRNVYLKKI
jgi:hypothetical protein